MSARLDLELLREHADGFGLSGLKGNTADMELANLLTLAANSIERILCITPEDVESTRKEANTWLESEDEYVVRWLRSLALGTPITDTPQDSSAETT